MLRNLFLIAVLLITISSLAFGVTWNSVMVPNITRIDINYFNNNNYIVEAVFGTKARLCLNETQELLLKNMGYSLIHEDAPPAPLVSYPTTTEINASLQAIVTAHPSIARLELIGSSVQGREIYALVVSDNVAANEAEPEIRITGNIHGDEKTAGMSCLNFAQVLTDNYGTSDMCTYVVDNAEVWIISIVNPDGYTAGNRVNANGIDLNRNCSYMGPGGGGGSTAFSEPETAAIRDLTMQSWPAINNFTHPFATGLSFHSGAECFNAVWNYSETAAIQDLAFITAQGNAYANHPSINSYYGAGTWDVWIPGASWYPTNGDVNDWSYGEVGTVDHTIEVSFNKSDPDWPGIANANYMPMLDFCMTSTYGIYGTVKDGNGDPLDALIEISIPDGTDSSPLRFCRTDVVDAGYSKALVPGTYNVIVTVDGMGSQAQNGVVVGAEEMVPVNFVFSTGIEDETFHSNTFITVEASPNPVTSSCTFTLSNTGVEGSLEIYDISGRFVCKENIQAAVTSYVFNAASELPTGVYQVRFISGGLSASTRLVVVD